jgi:hypothetical protein
MTEQELSLIAAKVVDDTQFWIGLVGVVGAIVGSVLTLAGNFALEWFKSREQRKIDHTRQKILKKCLKTKRFNGVPFQP